MGITAFTTKRPEGKPDQLQAFARLENFGPEEVATDVELFVNEGLHEASNVKIPPGETTSVVFDLADIHAAVVRLHTGAGGDLPDDDNAYSAVTPPQRGKTLLVTPGNDALELALKTEHAAEWPRFRSRPPTCSKPKSTSRRPPAARTG